MPRSTTHMRGRFSKDPNCPSGFWSQARGSITWDLRNEALEWRGSKKPQVYSGYIFLADDGFYPISILFFLINEPHFIAQTPEDISQPPLQLGAAT